MLTSKMKSFFAIILTMLVVLTVPSISLASEISETDNGINSTNIETLANNSSSFTMELKVNMASKGEIHYLGFNPTVSVKATGNPNMRYKVWVINPVGIKGDVGYVYANGSDTLTKNLFLSVGGDYHIYVQPWGGSSNGNTVYFNFNVTW